MKRKTTPKGKKIEDDKVIVFGDRVRVGYLRLDGMVIDVKWDR